MIHARQTVGSATPAQPRPRLLAGAAALLVALLATACDGDGGVGPGNGFFGQRGSIEVTVEAPLLLGEGRLTEDLVWSSSGEWLLEEAIAYRGVEGDRAVRKSKADPAESALQYAFFIEKLNDVEAEKLFVPDLSPDTIPECEAPQSRITFTIRDAAREESVTWIRCAFGSLANLDPEGAGPEAAAARVVNAAILARGATLGVSWNYTYLGSVPFGTLERGSGSASPLTAPVTFIDVGGFTTFWARHAPGRAPPAVDFTKDMVVVGIMGPRREAGDSVEIRRILRVADGTLTEVVERVPGDFCSPASRTHTPFHIVVAPRTPIPHRFADVQVEYPPCGG